METMLKYLLSSCNLLAKQTSAIHAKKKHAVWWKTEGSTVQR